MPGSGLLGDGGMSMGQPQGMQPMGQPQMPGMGTQPMGMQGMGQQSGMQNNSTISTDFANTQPGLPNLPDSFSGFGYGQFAPKEVQTQGNGTGGMQGGMRQQMISQLMQHLMPQLMNGQGFGG
jgi:hypothetical protein